MIVGAMRSEEARAFSDDAGFHAFGGITGSFEIFWANDDDLKLLEFGAEQAEYMDPMDPGWYWWSCFPGCLPDGGDPVGPFSTSTIAKADANEGYDND